MFRIRDISSDESVLLKKKRGIQTYNHIDGLEYFRAKKFHRLESSRALQPKDQNGGF